MPGFDKRESSYAEARGELLHELLRTGAFDMDEHERGEHVSRIVRSLQERYPALDDQMTRRLIGEGMQRTYGDATTYEAERREREAP